MPDSIVSAADGSIWYSAAELSPCHNDVTCQTEALGKFSGARATETLLGSTSLSATYGVTVGPNRTLWVTDALKAASIFDLSGKQIEKLKVRSGNGGGALSAPFIGPDGRMWFARGSFGEGATGIVAVDSSYAIQPVVACGQCFFSGGVVAADGNAWLLDPYLGGFYRVTPDGTLTRFDYGKFELQTIVAGPQAALWGLINGNIAAYGLMGHLLRTFAPPVAVQSGLHVIGNDLVWANFGPSKKGGTELDIARVSAQGEGKVHRYFGVSACKATDPQWFSQGPAVGGDGALYVAIGCSPEQVPYTNGGHAAIVRIDNRP
ncbi:MAG: hypothetical protein IAI50_18575 [Candidatus Eremiobacteraeota bacterium]|nr:hypothetical protein [Candidatus Eremiobacteraeota bacterium]